LANVYEYGDYSGTPRYAVNPLQGIRNQVPAGVTVSYHQGCGVNTSGSPDPAAVSLAAASNVAIVFVGLDGTIENEGIDRSSLSLPGIQENLITAIRNVNPNTIVVFINGSCVAVSSTTKANVPAFVEAWYAGEEAGTAIADVLFGDYNPGGRLPLTFYSGVNQLPSMSSYSLTTSPGRTYMYYTGAPLWAFGHGLSYTTFAYSNLQLSATQITDIGQLTVSATVTNTGTRAGDEVVQLYVHDVSASVTRAIKELKGFKRISLNPGASQVVTFTLPASELAFWSTSQHAFYVEPGQFQVMVGSSSADIRLQGTFNVVVH
jgi:beta-glucosidase